MSDSRNLRPALSAVPVELHGLLVGRHCHEPHRVPISQGRKQLANQRRGDSPAPEREREREWMTNIDSAGQIAPYSARLTEPNQIEELTCRLDALRINYWAWQEWAVSCVNPESTRSL